MNHLIKLFCLIASSTLLISCATAPPPTSLSWGGEFPLISATKNTPPKGKLKSLGNVSSKVCTTDGELTTRIGLLDTLVSEAQKSKNADYIAFAKVERVSDFCATLVGKAVSESSAP